ncbi:unnamed protein product [Caenorhabditis auriculariae]|uniref:Uncharacterized protein n=1 Tax=Caenorhabditis auriculariae TaxID=2777116 RepID=A0A8S1HCX4_9PELO|nr:unnamed protein product [Caenorhabditis auriculariae]
MDGMFYAMNNPYAFSLFPVRHFSSGSKDQPKEILSAEAQPVQVPRLLELDLESRLGDTTTAHLCVKLGKARSWMERRRSVASKKSFRLSKQVGAAAQNSVRSDSACRLYFGCRSIDSASLASLSLVLSLEKISVEL